MTGCVVVYTPEDYCCGCSECSCEPVDNSENRLYNNNIINDVCGIARPAAVGTRFAPRFAKHGSKSGKQREMKMAVQYEDNILPDLKPFLDENLRLTAIPAKNKKKLSALYYLAGKIEPNRDYTEPEINDILDDWTCFHDPATLRRELFNKGLVDRTPDCSRYRKAEAIPPFAEFIAKFI